VASRTTIAKGESTTLGWITTNASSVSIDPLGNVPLRGSVSVSPTITTAYTLTAIGPIGSTTARVTVEVISAAEVTILARPDGMLDVPGRAGATDRIVLANIGGTAAQINLAPSGQFFSVSSTALTLPPRSIRKVTITASAMPAGIHRGEIVISGEGLPRTGTLPIYLLVVPLPSSRSASAASSYRVDRDDARSASVTFTNTGAAPIEGLLVADQSWMTLERALISIAPGQSVTTAMTFDRSERAGADATRGGRTGSVSLRHLRGTTGLPFTSMAEVTTTTTPPPSVSLTTVVVKDLATPAVSSSAVPPLAPGEIAYFIPGLAHRGTTIGDLTLLNGTGAPSDLRLFSVASGSSPQNAQLATLAAVAPNSPLAFPDLVAGVFGQQSASTSVAIRGNAPQEVTVQASALSLGSGFFGGTLSAFRSDRSVPAGDTLHLAGVKKDTRFRTDLHLQETSGMAATALVDFLDDRGNVIGSTSVALGGFQYLEKSDIVPEGAVTLRVRNEATSTGNVVARALVVDGSSGDLTDVIDWRRASGSVSGETQIVPYVARLRGTVMNVSTDLTLANSGSTPATVTVDFAGPGVPARRRSARPSSSNANGRSGSHGTDAVEAIVLQPGETRVVHDILVSRVPTEGSGLLRISSPAEVTITATLAQEPATGAVSSATALPVLPQSAGMRQGDSRHFIDLEDAAAAAASERRPGTFRTAFGVAEVAGQSVTVRATMQYAYTTPGSKVTLRASAVREYTVAPNQPLLVTEMARALIGPDRDDMADLHDVQLDLEVVGGDGAAIPFVISTDNGTGDSLIKWE